MYNYNQDQNIILYNNKDILVGDKPVFIREWYQNGILSIQDLLITTGQLMSYQDFLKNYPCKRTNFLQYYQVISAILKRLLNEAKNRVQIKKRTLINTFDFELDESSQINLTKTRTSDFYKLFDTKTHTDEHKGHKNGTNTFQQEKTCGKSVSPPSNPFVRSPS